MPEPLVWKHNVLHNLATPFVQTLSRQACAREALTIGKLLEERMHASGFCEFILDGNQSRPISSRA